MCMKTQTILKMEAKEKAYEICDNRGLDLRTLEIPSNPVFLCTFLSDFP